MTARSSGTSSPSPKRIKLEIPEETQPDDIYDTQATKQPKGESGVDELESLDGEHCSICLQAVADRTVIPTCSHEFCFECLLIWTEQSRRCPLCAQDIGEYLIHNIRSKYDFQKHHLTPLRTSPKPPRLPPQSLSGPPGQRTRGPRHQREWGRNERRERQRAFEAVDELERAIEKRKWIYRHGLYAKHVASNSYTRYRPFPSPSQFAASPDLITRATIFVRRELRVWGCLDVEFLTTFTISLMKSLDIRSESAVKLLAEFLDLDSEHDLRVYDHGRGPHSNAEHFAHELYCYLRSPFRDLAVYDSAVQYDVLQGISLPGGNENARRSRWRPRSRSPSAPPRHSVSRSPSPNRSRRRSQRSRRSTNAQNLDPPLRNLSHSPDHRNSTKSSPQIIPVNGNSTDGLNQRFGKRTDRDSEPGRKDSKGKGRAVEDHDQNLHSAQFTGDSSQQESSFAHPRSPIEPHMSRSRLDQISISSNDPKRSENMSAPLSSLQNEPEHSRQRRPRMAWGSVQSHLSKAGEPRGVKNDHILAREATALGGISIRGAATSRLPSRANLEDASHEAHPSQPANHSTQELATHKPSLLHRISDPFEDTISAQDGSTDGSPSLCPPVLFTSTPPVSANRTESSKVADSTLKMSAPEIMARTRARMAKIKNRLDGDNQVHPNDDSSNRITISDQTTLPSFDEPPISTQQPPKDTSASPLNSESSVTRSGSDLRRQRLLNRLEKERRVHSDSPFYSPHDDNKPPSSFAAVPTVREDVPHGIPTHDPSSSTSSSRNAMLKLSLAARSDAEMREAALRNQARLRAGLVAALPDNIQGESPRSGDGGEPGERLRAGVSSSRENILKERLKRAREQS